MATRLLPSPLPANHYSLQPVRAWRGIKRLIADKEDTEAVFEIMRALSGRSIPKGYQRLLRTVEGGALAMRAVELAPILDDHETLNRLPDGSVGRAYVAFVDGRRISAEGLAAESRKAADSTIDANHPYAWYARRLRDVHDLWHVLTGYNTDALGEACVVAFSYAQTGSKGFALIALAAARELSRALPDQPVAKAIWQAFQLGRHARWLPEVDVDVLLQTPLDQARRDLNLSAPATYEAIPERLRDGGMVPQPG